MIDPETGYPLNDADQEAIVVRLTNPMITIVRSGNRIYLKSDSDADIAWLTDGDNALVRDRLADTREAMGLVDYDTVIESLGLDVRTIRAIDAAGGR
jgi:hypothetical protein